MITKYNRSGLDQGSKAGKGDKDRPVATKKFNAHFDAVKWDGGFSRSPIKSQRQFSKKYFYK